MTAGKHRGRRQPVREWVSLAPAIGRVLLCCLAAVFPALDRTTIPAGRL